MEGNHIEIKSHVEPETEPIKKLTRMKFYDWPDNERHALIPRFVIPIIIVNILALQQGSPYLLPKRQTELHAVIYYVRLYIVCTVRRVNGHYWCICIRVPVLPPVCVLSHLSLSSTSANIISYNAKWMLLTVLYISAVKKCLETEPHIQIHLSRTPSNKQRYIVTLTV